MSEKYTSGKYLLIYLGISIIAAIGALIAIVGLKEIQKKRKERTKLEQDKLKTEKERKLAEEKTEKKRKLAEEKTEKERKLEPIRKSLDSLSEESKNNIIKKLFYLFNQCVKAMNDRTEEKDIDSKEPLTNNTQLEIQDSVENIVFLTDIVRFFDPKNLETYTILLLREEIYKDHQLKDNFKIISSVQEEIDRYESQYNKHLKLCTTLTNLPIAYQNLMTDGFAKINGYFIACLGTETLRNLDLKSNQPETQFNVKQFEFIKELWINENHLNKNSNS